jgi:hypothetical protein
MTFGERLFAAIRAARPVLEERVVLACPHRRAALTDMSDRVASATRRCDVCGGQILHSGGPLARATNGRSAATRTKSSGSARQSTPAPDQTSGSRGSPGPMDP